MWWDKNLWLLTPDEFNDLPDGTILIAIDGEQVVKGESHIDMDIRAGYLAYGFNLATAPLKWKHLFLDKAR